MRPIAAMVGDVDEGKSTLTNALVGNGLVAPDSPLKLTSCLSELRVCKDRARRSFGVIADGEETEVAIEALWDTMMEVGQGQQNIERVLLYAESSALLEQLRLIDLPGMDDDEKVLEFLQTEPPDVLVHVASESGSVRLFSHTDTTLPSERLIVVSKIDRGINWTDPNFCIETVATETEDRVHQDVKNQTDDETKIVAASGLLGLACDLWDAGIFQGILRLAEPGDFEVVSKTTYFNEERAGLLSIKDRQALLDQANAAFQPPWISPEYCKPAWPALMFSTCLAIHDEVQSPEALRQKIHRFSGIDRLRSVLLSVSQSPRILEKHERLETVGEAEAEMLRLNRSLSQLRLLLQETDRMATTVTEAIGQTQQRKYYDDITAHLEEQQINVSMRLREKQQWLSGVKKAYRQTASNHSDERSEKCSV